RHADVVRVWVHDRDGDAATPVLDRVAVLARKPLSGDLSYVSHRVEANRSDALRTGCLPDTCGRSTARSPTSSPALVLLEEFLVVVAVTQREQREHTDARADRDETQEVVHGEEPEDQREDAHGRDPGAHDGRQHFEID